MVSAYRNVFKIGHSAKLVSMTIVQFNLVSWQSSDSIIILQPNVHFHFDNYPKTLFQIIASNYLLQIGTVEATAAADVVKVCSTKGCTRRIFETRDFLTSLG